MSFFKGFSTAKSPGKKELKESKDGNLYVDGESHNTSEISRKIEESQILKVVYFYDPESMIFRSGDVVKDYETGTEAKVYSADQGQIIIRGINSDLTEKDFTQNSWVDLVPEKS